jgi:FkbM family methyltransferase
MRGTMFTVSVNINLLKVFSLIRQNTKRRTLRLYLKWFILRRLRLLPLIRTAVEYLQIVESAKLTAKREMAFIERISRHQGTYIDVGAHIGDTIYWAQKATMVIAIEPDPRCLNQIITVARKLKLRNFKLFARVAGDGEELEFAITAEGVINTGVNRLMDQRRQNITKVVKTKSYRLDELLNGINLPTPVLIKIDAEGMEPQVLDGAYKIIRDYKPTLLIETHMNTDECLRKLETYNYIVVEMIKRNNVVTHIIAETKIRNDSSTNKYVVC